MWALMPVGPSDCLRCQCLPIYILIMITIQYIMHLKNLCCFFFNADILGK